MSFSGFIVQLLNGLASASSLFLVAAGLSLIFGVTRIVNFAHGSFYMVGVYVAYALVSRLEWLGFWFAVPIAAISVGLIGVVAARTSREPLRARRTNTWPMAPRCRASCWMNSCSRTGIINSSAF